MNKNLKYIFVIFCLVVSASRAFAQTTTTADGWAVTFKGATNPTATTTTYTYQACPTNAQSGRMTIFSLGVPSCFPQFNVIAASPTTSLTIDQDKSNGVYGIVWRNLRLTACQTFSYTLAGAYTAIDKIDVGVTADDSCGSCCTNCGAASVIAGPKCEIKGVGVCGDIARSDIAIMLEQSASISKAGADKIRSAASSLVQDFSGLRVSPRIAIGGFNYGNNAQCNSTGWPSGFVKPYLKDYARFISLLNGTATTVADAWDYDGFLQRDYGIPGLTEATSSNTYRALLGYSNQSPYTCGSSPMDAAIEVSDRHISSVYGSGYSDPQSDNYIILVSTGRPSQYGTVTCSNPCDCAEAKAAAKAKRDAALNDGVKIAAVYFNDATTCTAAQIQAGKDFLKNQIASDPSLYFESDANSIGAVLKTVKTTKLTQTVTCDQSQFANSCGASCDLNDNGGTCKPIVCGVPPTPTPAPQGQCGFVDVTNILLALDQQGFNSTARVSQVARLLREVYANNPTRLARVNAVYKTTIASAKALQKGSWTTIWSIPAKVKSCPASITCNRQDATVKVNSASASFSSILSLADKLFGYLPKTLTHAQKVHRDALKKAIASDAAAFARSTALLPDLTAICS